MNLVKRLLFASRQGAKTLALPYLRARFRREIRRFESPYRLHLGCGSHHLDNWVNIDFIRTPAVDVWWNLGQPVPLGDRSCSFIFHEHVLEHFELERGLSLLNDCYRLLKPGGVLRVAMPDLDDMLLKCANGEWRFRRSAHMPKVATKSEYLNVMFRAWGHQWIYDYDELERRLREVGFNDVCRQELGQSRRSELRGVEYRDDSCLICEAIKGRG